MMSRELAHVKKQGAVQVEQGNTRGSTPNIKSMASLAEWLSNHPCPARFSGCTHLGKVKRDTNILLNARKSISKKSRPLEFCADSTVLPLPCCHQISPVEHIASGRMR